MHAAREPDPDHGGDQLGAVRQLDRDAPAGHVAELSPAICSAAARAVAREHGAVDRVEQRIGVRERVLHQESSERHVHPAIGKAGMTIV